VFKATGSDDYPDVSCGLGRAAPSGVAASNAIDSPEILRVDFKSDAGSRAAEPEKRGRRVARGD
jgi:hypothetical protein